MRALPAIDQANTPDGLTCVKCRKKRRESTRGVRRRSKARRHKDKGSKEFKPFKVSERSKADRFKMQARDTWG